MTSAVLKFPAYGRPEAVIDACLVPPDQFSAYPQKIDSAQHSEQVHRLIVAMRFRDKVAEPHYL